MEEEWSTVLTLQNNKSQSLAIEVRREEHGFVTQYTEGRSGQDMPTHSFRDGPSSSEGSMDGANQNWTQKYLKEARNHCHSSPAELLHTQIEGLLCANEQHQHTGAAICNTTLR